MRKLVAVIVLVAAFVFAGQAVAGPHDGGEIKAPVATHL